ncbi:MAG: short-chain fatty acyl-CoA regulator family protein [Pseudomonadota bacterium]
MSDTLTGSRIRERRGMLGLRQAALARSVGISASYLNLIEHNRRRIGGKLLLDLSAELGVEPSALTEGAEAALVAALREAASEAGLAEAELDRADEFAGRFAGWAEVLAGAHRRIRSLEQTVKALSDRLAHDPELAASLHEVLSTAAAIRSTAAILADDTDIAPEWQAKFHGNLDEDSRRLSDSAKALVQFLDADEGTGAAASPQEELDAFLEARGWSFPEVEEGGADVDALIAEDGTLGTRASAHMARTVLGAVAADAAALPLKALRAAEAQVGQDPLAIAQMTGARPARVLRRMAALHVQGAGLVVCDRAGSLIFRKPLDGFALPRFGAPCPLWPIFDALAQPGHVVRAHVVQPGAGEVPVQVFAVAEPVAPAAYNAPPLLQATMLILPAPGVEAARAVGSTCRTCPVAGCAVRREPSILAEGL